MNKEKTFITGKLLGERKIFRIFDIEKATCVNIRIIEEVNKELKQIVDWEEDEELAVFVKEELDAQISSDEDIERIVKFLESQKATAEGNFIAFSHSVEGFGTVTDFVEIGGIYFGIVEVENSSLVRIVQVEIGPKAEIRSINPIDGPVAITLIAHSEMTRMDPDEADRIIQYNENSFMCLRRVGNDATFVNLEIVQKDNEQYLATSEDSVRYFVINGEEVENGKEVEGMTDEKERFISEMITKLNSCHENKGLAS